MKKKILIGSGAILIVLLAFVAYKTVIAARKSPSKTTTYADHRLDIKVEYSQPSKRGRLIFGMEKDGALQPYGKYWRLGANAATKITFSKNINFAGQPVNAGTYRMYAIPGAETFKVFLNSVLDNKVSASLEPDHSKDVLSVDVPVQTSPSETETFVINFSSDAVGVKMDFVWDKTLVRVPITIQ